MANVVKIICRVPFTLVMLIGIGTVGFLTGAFKGELAPNLLQRFGFSLDDLWQGTWYSLVTEVWFTGHPSMYWGILVFVVVSIGIYEWQSGTRRALWLYWLTDIGGTLIVALGFVLPLFLLKTDLGMALAFNDDIGMSGGGFGCVGGWISGLSKSFPRAFRKWAWVTVMAYLVVHLWAVTDISSDILHIVTFLLGSYLNNKLFRQKATDTTK